ncbi:hypothetical protein JCM8097_004532 [Rhodosporidiobolus ruineniae]
MSTPTLPAPSPPSSTASLAASAPPSPHSAHQPEVVYPPPQPPQQPTEQQQDGGVGVAPALAVRLGLMCRVWASLVEMEGPRRRRFAFFSFAGFAQIVSFIVILALAYTKPCDRPLGPYLIMIIVRLAVAFPISFWQSISARPRGAGTTPRQREEWEQNRPLGSETVDRQVRRFSDFVSLLSLVLFFLGNYWLISENTCHISNPILYKGALAALILQWLWTTEIILYFMLILFFLPFFLIGARWFGLGEKKNEVGPLSKNVIESLPKRLFVGTIPDDPSSTPEANPSTATPAAAYTASNKSKTPASSSVSPAAPASISSSSPSGKKQWWRLWRRRAATSSSSGGEGGSGRAEGRVEKLEVGEFVPFPAGVEPLRVPESQSACSICLCEYDPPPLRSAPSAEREAWKPAEEMLSLLPCEHAFHSGCLKDWLAVSGRKGKKGGYGGGGGGTSNGGAGAEQRV